MKTRLRRIVCPNCGKTVAAGFASVSSDGLSLVTYRHNDRDGVPCPTAEVSAQ